MRQKGADNSYQTCRETETQNREDSRSSEGWRNKNWRQRNTRTLATDERGRDRTEIKDGDRETETERKGDIDRLGSHIDSLIHIY